MSLDRRDFLKLGLGACLLPFIGSARSETLISEHMYVFGTLVDVEVSATDEMAARRAIDAVAQDFMIQNKDWHAWKRGALSDLNIALAAGRMHVADLELLTLLQEVTVLARASNGLFNPAIGGLVSAWGFHNDLPLDGPPPAKIELERWRQTPPTMDDLIIEGNMISSRNRALRLDLGGYAKGVALNRALDRLATLGFNDALVNLGGNLAVAGKHGDRPWRIGIRHPQGSGALAAVEVSGRTAVVTSGTYERYRDYEGHRYHHIIDPRTGQPAQHVASATVIHRDAARADVAATALVVAGMKDWPQIACSMGIDNVMMVDDEGRVQLTAAMARQVRFLESPLAIKVVSLA